MLVLDRAVYDEIVDHARAGAPEEVCGILGGTFDSEGSHAARSYRTENVADTPRTAYAVAPEAQFAVMEDIESDGDDVAGFYHSHPRGPPTPSRTDRQKATWEGYSYVVVALDGRVPFVGSWRWTGEAFRQEIVSIE